MFQSLCVILAFVSVVRAQGLPYFMDLDRNYALSWGFDNESITFQLDVQNRGWVSLSLLSDSGTLLDVWWGGYDEEYDTAYIQDAFAEVTNLQVGPRFPDTINNLNVITVSQSPFVGTRVRFSRPFVTRDPKQDIDILDNARQLLLWSYSDTDLPSSNAVASGTVQVVLRPVEYN